MVALAAGAAADSHAVVCGGGKSVDAVTHCAFASAVAGQRSVFRAVARQCFASATGSIGRGAWVAAAVAFHGTRSGIALGLLPSAGRLSLDNYYLWRNLLIELGILVPLFGLLVALARGTAPRLLARSAAFVIPLWLAMLAWSVSLQR